MKEIQESTQLGVSAEVAEALERWVGEGRFGSTEQACRFGIIIAMAKGVIAPANFVADLPVVPFARFDTSDPVGVAVQLLYTTTSDSLYRTLERLAEGGLRAAINNVSLLGESPIQTSPNADRDGRPEPPGQHNVEDELQYLQRLLSSVPARYRSRKLTQLGLPTRAERALQREGIHTVDDLRACEAITLRGIPNFGRKSVRDVADAIEALLTTFDAASEDKAADNTGTANDDGFTSRTMAELLSGGLQKLNRREGLVLRGRLGLSGKILTLQELGDEIGITRERVRQIQTSAAKKAGLPTLAETANSKLKGLFDGGIETVFAEDLAHHDAWFGGLDGSPKLLQELLKNFGKSPVHFHQVDKKWLATRASPSDIKTLADQSFNRIKQGLSRHMTRMNVGQIISAECVRAGYPEAQLLVYRKLSGALHFSSGISEESDALLALGKNMEARALAVLKDHGSPMHYEDVARAIAENTGKSIDERTVHNALPRSGAILIERGTFGLPEWISLDADTKHQISAAAEEVMSASAVEKQWHSQELLDAIANRRPELPLPESVHVFSAILKQNKKLKYLKRQVWALCDSGYQGTASRFDIRTLCEEILEQWGRPMTTDEIRHEVSQRRGVGPAFQIHPAGRLVKLGRGRWGLKNRDQ